MFKEIRPRSSLLNRYIISYNLLAEQPSLPLHYCAFPQPGTSLAFFTQTAIQTGKTDITFSPGATDSRTRAIVLGKYLSPLIIRYTGWVNEISINFKPAAINHFFGIPFRRLAPGAIQEITLDGALPPELFHPDTDKKIASLEAFLLGRLSPKPLDQLEKAVALLEADETIEVGRLAQLVNLTERTLCRSFSLHIGCPPSSFKRILRFRKAIDAKHRHEQRINCTDVCFSNSYYDTAHFRKEFRRLTGQNPGTFFDTLSLIGEGKYPFKIV